MGIIKRLVGGLCMPLAIYAAYLLTSEGMKKIAAAAPEAKANATTQWGILIFIFIPVMAGLFIFGMYAAKGEYEEVR